jgi:hypothetical protein
MRSKDVIELGVPLVYLWETQKVFPIVVNDVIPNSCKYIF